MELTITIPEPKFKDDEWVKVEFDWHLRGLVGPIIDMEFQPDGPITKRMKILAGEWHYQVANTNDTGSGSFWFRESRLAKAVESDIPPSELEFWKSKQGQGE